MADSFFKAAFGSAVLALSFVEPSMGACMEEVKNYYLEPQYCNPFSERGSKKEPLPKEIQERLDETQRRNQNDNPWSRICKVLKEELRKLEAMGKSAGQRNYTKALKKWRHEKARAFKGGSAVPAKPERHTFF